MKTSFEDQLISFIPSLKYFAFSLTKNKMDSEDLTSKTVLRALEQKNKYREETNFKAWVLTIMRNFFINDYRASKRHGHTIDISNLSSFNLAIDDNCDKKILLDQVLEFLDKQPERLSKPILMYSQGYLYREIMEAMDEPEGTIKSRILLMREKVIKNC